MNMFTTPPPGGANQGIQFLQESQVAPGVEGMEVDDCREASIRQEWGNVKAPPLLGGCKYLNYKLCKY